MIMIDLKMVFLLILLQDIVLVTYFNTDFNASIDFENKHLRPPFKSDLHRLDFDANTQNSTLVNNGGILDITIFI